MPFVLIQFLPTRPSLGLLTFSDRQGEAALRFQLRFTGLKRDGSFVQAREPSLFQSCSLPSTRFRKSSFTARGRKLYALRLASVYLETLFYLYKNPVQCGEQRTPVSPESQSQYCKCSRDGTGILP